jgi:hypothetical protein
MSRRQRSQEATLRLFGAKALMSPGVRPWGRTG